MTSSNSEWQRVVRLANFPLSQIREEPTTMQLKETYYTLSRILKRGYWIKSRNKPLRRSIDRKNMELRQLFCLSDKQLKFWKIVWHKHYLLISSLVGSGHFDKYSYETPFEWLSGWGNLLVQYIGPAPLGEGNHSLFLMDLVWLIYT